MPDKLIILSDIHANLSALNAVIDDIQQRHYTPDAIVSLGDVINYGMRPNETISRLNTLPWPLAVNLCGNHEKAFLDGDLSRFSTDRGRCMLEYTTAVLSSESIAWITGRMNQQGCEVQHWQGKKILFVHGAIGDTFWGKIGQSGIPDDAYTPYDIVVSGHSHIPHLIEYLYSADAPAMRNKKRTLFINPGSVGQPRNHNNRAQYVYLELSAEVCYFNAVAYDIEAEQRLYPDFLDDFYKTRLLLGI